MNFRADLTADGVINGADITLVRRQSGSAFPQNTPVPGFALFREAASPAAYQFVFGSGGFTQGQGATASLKSEQAQIISVTKSGTAQVVRVDHAQTGFASVAGAVTQGSNIFAIAGSVSSTNRFFKGDIAEIIAYNRALSDSERQQVIDYLDTKYQISPALPVPITGLRAWFDAGTSIVKDATGLVTSWSDRFNGITAQTTGLKPQWSATSAGGQPAIRFDGNSILKAVAVDLQSGATTSRCSRF